MSGIPFSIEEKKKENNLITLEQMKEIFPGRKDKHGKTIDNTKVLESATRYINEYGPQFGITNKNLLAHYLAQAGHESGGFTKIPIESAYYKTTDRVKAAFGAHSSAYLHTLENPGKYLRNTVAFTNMAYAGIGNNGPESSGEGSKYLGRGYFQLTPKVNYQNFTKAYNKMFGTHANFVEHPEEVATNDKIAVISSLWYFQTFTIPAIQKGLDFGRITRTINAKELGLAERKNLYTKALQILNK